MDRFVSGTRHCEEQGDDPPSLALRAMARWESVEASLRVGGSNPVFAPDENFWIASVSALTRSAGLIPGEACGASEAGSLALAMTKRMQQLLVT